MFSTIMLATDLSFSVEGLVPYVMETARVYGSKVLAVHVRTNEWGELQEEAAVRLKNQLGGIPHEVIIKDGDVQSELLTFVQQECVDLVVVGTHGRTGIGRALLGSVAEAIFREAPCPVLTIRSQMLRPGAEPPTVKEVLLATDLTSVSAEATRYAVALAQENHCGLNILHVLPQSDEAIAIAQQRVTEALRRLEEAVPRGTHLWCDPYCLVEEGNPAEKILEVASKYSVNMIVLGIRPHSLGLATHLARRTAHRVVVGATCPVLTVRGWGKHARERETAKRKLRQSGESAGLCPA